MSALWACNIDNIIIEIDNIETPIFDGSSEPFFFFINSAGTKEQNARKKIFKNQTKN